MSYMDDLEIDKNSLDVEWEQQSHRYMKYAEKSAHAIAERDRAKERLEVVKAELDSKIRSNPKSYTGSDKKPTEEQIRNIILLQEVYKQQQAEYIQACEDANIYLSARSAFEHRKTALELLTKLFLSGYWADPRIPTEEKEGVQKLKGDTITRLHKEELNEDMAAFKKSSGGKAPLRRRK